MNTYTPCGNFVIDANGKQYAVDTPHPLPLPDGIDDNYDEILFGGAKNDPGWSRYQRSRTHWIARRPLPPVPRPKTQEKLDGEALNKAADEYDSVHRWAFTKGWDAGIAHAREEGK